MFYQNRIYAKKVVFVIDVSSTMTTFVRPGQTRLDIAKRELTNAIGRLPVDAFFNIVTFDGRFHIWHPGLMPATPATKLTVSQQIMALQNGHGTALYDALDAGLAFQGPEVVFLLSDGLPTAGTLTNPRDILQAINARNRFQRITINTISVGRESELLAALANHNGGIYRTSK